MTDGESFNYDGHSIPPAALELIIKRPKLIPEGIKDADVDNGSVSGIVFVSERDDLETLQIAIRISTSRKVATKVFSYEDVYPRSDGVRMEDSPCVAGARRDTLVYISTKEPAPRRRQPWTVVYKTHLKTGQTCRLTPSRKLNSIWKMFDTQNYIQKLLQNDYVLNFDWNGLLYMYY